MVPAIHNYWLGIMAGAFAIGMVAWIGLVFWADRHPHGYQQQEPTRRREVVGSAFMAHEGGRQVTPDRRDPPRPGIDEQPGPATGTAAEEPGSPSVPGQRESADEPARRAE